MIPSADTTKHQLSVKPFAAYFAYLSKAYPEIDIGEACERAGLPLEYFENLENWVSVDWSNKFCDRCVELTGDPEFSFQAGKYITPESVDRSTWMLAKYLLSLNSLYRYAPKLVRRLNKVQDFQIIENRRGFIKYLVQPHLDVSNQTDHKSIIYCFNNYLMPNTLGYMTGAPTIKGLPEARVEFEKFSENKIPKFEVSIWFRENNDPWIWFAQALALGSVISMVGASLPGYLNGPTQSIVLLFLLFCVGFLGVFFTKAITMVRGQDIAVAETSRSMAVLDKRYRELQQARELSEQLRKLDYQKTVLFQNISHEFRTPLTLILGPIEDWLEMPEGTLPPRMVSDLESMKRNSRRLLRLINQLLDLSKLDSGNLHLNLANVDIVRLVHRVVAAFESAAERKDILLQYLPESECSQLSVDVEKIEQILINLLSNAVQFTDRGGRIRVYLSIEKEICEIVIKDNGKGISDKDIKHVFDRFWQVDDGLSRSSEGTGIGLSIVKEFVELHNGTIDVSSSLARGTEFTIKLPVLKNPESSSLPVESMGHVELELSVFPGELESTGMNPRVIEQSNAKVVIVEDNSEMLRMIASTFELTNWDVFPTENGLAGLECARNVQPDLIISDIMMPVMNGFELLSAVRNDKKLFAVPVMLLTAKAEESNASELLEAGANDYLYKPFQKRELLARSKNLIELKNLQGKLQQMDRQNARRALERYVSPDLVDEILQGNYELDAKPTSKTISILFSDLQGFTKLTSQVRAAKMGRILNEYLTEMNDVIFSNGGTIDKFIGDSIMVIFGAPKSMVPRKQAISAVRCAVDMQIRLRRLNEKWQLEEEKTPTLLMRIGIHQGPAVVGNFGSRKRSEFTAIGETVNLASRIEQVCEAGKISVSGAVADHLSESMFKECGLHDLKGIGQVRVYQISENPKFEY